MSGAQYSLTGQIAVALPPEAAFRLFTPRGEEQWVKGWRPRFPMPADDDAEPGTVFEVDVHGERTTWVVLDRRPGRRISYARVTPGSRAGTVTVVVTSDAAGGSAVQVTYELTALSPQGARELRDFAAGYPEFLASWQEAIAARFGPRSSDPAGRP
ncbi:SRPBCC family protein [Nonomuraea sp. NPDC048916]|uniref:SRPBCC family protein n=1 Tax=Nonomuraea sp. NPDC048916 TaxID=3154232 RepID=UPI0033F6206A